MVELFVEGKKVVLSKEISADITYSLADIRTPDKRQVNYSKTLTIVGTSHNDFLFGNIYDIDTDNGASDPLLPNTGVNYTPKKLAKAVMLADGIQIFDGTLRLWKVVKKNGETLYEVSLFGKLFDLFGAIGDAKLTDLDFSDLNHAITWANITATWEALWAGAFRYPYIDYGEVDPDGTTGQPLTLKFGSMSPCLYYKVYIDKIFSAISSSYLLNFADTSVLDAMLLTPQKGGIFGRPLFFYGTGTVPTRTYTDTFSKIRIVDNNSPDPLGMIVSGDYSQLSILSNISTSFQFNINFGVTINNYAFGSNPNTLSFEIRLLRSGIETVLASYSEVFGYFGLSSNSCRLEIIKKDYLAGDKIYIISDYPFALYSLNIYHGSSIEAISPNDPNEYNLVEGDIYDMNKAIPDGISQVEFIKDFIKLFNLFVTQDPDDSTIFTFTPQVEFYNNDKSFAIDWTNKVDHNEEIEITPLGQLTAKEYIVSWKEDKDHWNALYQQQNKEIYGQVTYISDTDIISNKQEVKMLFSPAVMQRFPDSQVLCPSIYKVEIVGLDRVKKTDKFNSRIVLWGGLQPAGHDIELLTSTGATHSTVTDYPFCGHINHPFTPTFDINFGNTNSDLPTASVNQFSKYWGPILKESVNKEGKLIACTMLLKPEDIESLDFAALYKIGSQHFRLNKVEGYNPFELSTCKVEFIKVLSL